MCELLNIFVPVAGPVLGPPVRRFALTTGGEAQRDFAQRFAGRGGTILSGAGGCMCGFDDWAAVYEVGRSLFDRNRVVEVAALRFWSGDRYALGSRIVDPDDEASCTPFVVGEVVVMRREPSEKRRHRDVVRALAAQVGAVATLRLKSGGHLRGLVTFDVASETGRVGEVPFVAAQVRAVEVVR